MSTRPSRVTRSSAAATSAVPAAPATRSRPGSSLSQTAQSTLAAGPQATRRTTRSSRANTPVPPSDAVDAPKTRGTAARTAAATRPQWGAPVRTPAVSTPPQSAVRRPAGSSLAVPTTVQRTRTPGQSLLSRMTSRDSLRQQATKTPARASAPTPAPAHANGLETYDGRREPIKAYLRIRPAPDGVPLQSYIQILNNTDVLMVPPADHRLNPSSSSATLFSNALLRSSNLALNPASHPSGVPDDVLASPTPHVPDPSTYGTLYKFTSVFPSPASPSATPIVSPTSPTFTPADREKAQRSPSQAEFFRSTTLPLVRDFLQNGENCLLFAYGSTGSGKTFTVQGGKGEDAGLLPRVVEVVWKSLEAKRQRAVTPPGSRRPGGPLMSTPNGKGPQPAEDGSTEDATSEVVAMDAGFDYSVLVSYSEVYNEKIYDLLEAPLLAPPPSTPAPASHAGGGGGGMFKGLFKNFTTVKRSALSLKADKGAPAAGPGQAAAKVVGGLREIKVSSAEEAHGVLARGQSNRRVFSTLANRASSRSHSIFTLKLVRTCRTTGVESTSRFSIVDLAGSERVVNTQTTGDRLKEAGNINKSLMVLGQCMEVLRKNQEKEKGRKPAIVPFRHSKLTEMFQSFFVGDGKAVMVVNVNPYETGFDENSHVMKFSAVAKGVMTVKREPEAYHTALAPGPSLPIDFEIPEIKKAKPEPRLVRISLVDDGEEQEVLYEEEDVDDEDADEDEFVNALLDELSALRTALFESRMQVELAQSSVRAQVVKEYEEKMLEMERRYQARLREEATGRAQADEAEMKLNAKLDILTRLQAAKTPGRGATYRSREQTVTPSTQYDDSDEEGIETEREGAGESFVDEDEAVEGETNDSEEVQRMLMPETDDAESPLAARVKLLSVDRPIQAKTETLPVRSPLSRETVRDHSGEDLEPTQKAADREDAVESDEGSETVSDASREDSFGPRDEARAEVDEYSVPLKMEDDRSTRTTGAADKENESPLGHGDRTLGEIDALGMDKSMVIRSSGGGAKKTKRKLGVKVVDVEDIDTYEGVLSPIRKTPSDSRHF
ncbi:hypothetical protein BMF94_3661 [Rhodotorula taiwanensis]|uniref:Kinesin motor domain-containing protein n=1 Tax=Rhodotorula taiwanensis TaxID=741276 RepID=A0A2S5B975_9BASI|nr:hypothetical protein BMF94_3661 [Rhodotorula taiwanensis]